MRSLPGTLLVFALVMLLVGTTPIGTGEGVHQDEILHPVLPHLHMIDGRIVSHDDTAAVVARTPIASQATPGPALGAGNGADAAGLGVAISPTVPLSALAFPMIAVGWAALVDMQRPTEFLDPPTDPPPNFAG